MKNWNLSQNTESLLATTTVIMKTLFKHLKHYYGCNSNHTYLLVLMGLPSECTCIGLGFKSLSNPSI